jgi:hypothetical protein
MGTSLLNERKEMNSRLAGISVVHVDARVIVVPVDLVGYKAL